MAQDSGRDEDDKQPETNGAGPLDPEGVTVPADAELMRAMGSPITNGDTGHRQNE